MSRLWLSPQQESRLLDEVKHRNRTRRLQAARVTADMVNQAEMYADAYPWMDPTATQSFLQAGVPVDDPRIQEAAALAAEDIRPDPTDAVAGSWWEAAATTILNPLKSTIRGGLTVLAAPMEELQAIVSAAGEVIHSDPKHEGGWTLGEVIADLGELGPDLQRFWENYTQRAAASGLRLAIGDLVAGRDVDLGEGFIPGSYHASTMALPGFTGGIYGRRERDKHRLQLDGDFITPGRLIARDVVEPGTKAYQFISGGVDFASHLVADPTIYATAGLSKAARATKTFQATGLIDGLRRTVQPERAVQHYLSSPAGQGFKRWITETDDTRRIWDVTKRADLELAHRLARATDETAVHNILSETLGTVIRERPTAGFVSRQFGRVGGDYGRLFGGGAVVREQLNARNFRLFNDMPGPRLQLGNLDQSADDLEKWMRNAKLDDETISHFIGRLASEVPEGGGTALYNISRDVMASTRGVLVKEWGVSETRARAVTRMWDNIAEANRAFQADSLGREIDALAPLKAHVGGKTIDATPNAAIVADLISTAIPLPDPRAIRRLTPFVKKLQGFYDSGLWQGPIDFMDFAMSTVWKPLQLARFAYTTRVIMEEQVRMAGAGLDSLASNPVRAISTMVAMEPSSRLAQRVAKASTDIGDILGRTTAAARRVTKAQVTDDVGGGMGRFARTMMGEEFTEELAEFTMAMSRGSAGHRGFPGEMVTGRWTKVRHGEDSFHRGWSERLVHLYHDPVMKRVARGLDAGDVKSIQGGYELSGDTFNDVFAWWWRGAGRKHREEIATAIGGELGPVLRNNPDAARDYLRQNFFEQLERLTGGNSDLMQLVGTGVLDDISIRALGGERKLTKRLADEYDSAAPAYVPMEDRIAVRMPGQRTLQRVDRFIEDMFGFLMSKPTNYLSRSPAFRQFYWQRGDELIGFADEATQAAMIKAAREANVSKEVFDSMVTKAARGGPGTQITSLDDADLLARGFALEQTKTLLYDLGKRSQFFDQMRLVFPFGEAWKEIATSWGRIMHQNPHVVRRAQQALHGARGGDQDPSTGFFHTDPQTGDEVFTYPDFGILSAIAGTGDTGRLRPVGRAAGLNVVSATVLPGFGPMVQIPVQNIIPKRPEFSLIHELVSPFGEAPGRTLPEQIVGAFTPAWLEKVQTAMTGDPQSDRLFANTVMDVMRALHRSGKPIDTVDNINALYDEATDKARLLYFIRGIAQSTVPTGPQFAWETADVEGNLVPVRLLSDELRRMTDEEFGGDRNAAFLEWTRRFGVDNVLAIIPKSQEIVERPVTQQGDDWLRANVDLERKFPTTVGYFAPEPAAGEFDYDAYLRAFDTGARQPFTPDEMIALANDFLGRVEYEQAKRVAEMRPGPQTALWLAQVREGIAQRRPGFDGWLADRVREQRPAVDQQIAEIRDAVTDPRIAQTDAGRGTIKYLSAIEAAEKMVFGLKGNVRRYQQAKAAAPIRAFLRSTAETIIEEHPDFAHVWNGIFSRELADDTDLMVGGG